MIAKRLSIDTRGIDLAPEQQIWQKIMVLNASMEAASQRNSAALLPAE